MIGIFANSGAGKGKALSLLSLLEKKLAEKEIPFAVYVDDWPETADQASEAWIVGGDGTLSFFINKYKSIKIPLAIFKGGTGNDFAWKLYGNATHEEQVDMILNGSHKKVDAAICNNKVFINGVGIGFDGEVLQSMSTIRLLGGHFGYLWIVIRKIFSFREQKFSIQTNKGNYSEKFLLVNISNSSRTGGGFLVSPEAEINDSKLNLVLCKPLSLSRRLKYLPVIEKGKHLALPFVVHELLDKTTVTCETETFAQLDGELICSKKFDIQVMPGHFTFKY